MNLYPPLLFQRVRIVEIREGFRYCRVEVRRSILTRNLNGSTFGGAIFSAADPFYPVMYWQIFARRGCRVRVWLKSAAVDYLKPARSALSLEFRLDGEEIERAALALEREGRFTARYRTDAVDRHGEACATIETEVYLRLPRPAETDLWAF